MTPPEPDAALREDLAQRARAVAAERGWSWREPIDVRAGREGGESAWIVRSNVHAMGTNVVAVFRRSDLALLRAGYMPR